jgi:hypothetical protein
MVLPNISIEQKDVLLNLENNNVIIDSIAGCGKTTTNLHIALKFNTLKILLLTYNSKLRIETKTRIKNENINNLEVHTYHSFCYKNYLNGCKDDMTIRRILNNKMKLLNNNNYDLLILDEAQDINPLYYELICKIFKDNNKNIKICILGDKYQSIYNYQGSDERFIVLGNKLFNFNSFSWSDCKLSISYRITDKMADFVNNCLLNNDRMKANNKSDYKPRYLICNVFNDIKHIYDEVKYYLSKKNITYEDIFILAPSVKGNKSPVKKLANMLSNNKIPIYIPNNDDEELNENVLNNKIVFSSFHKTKGLERKVIIIFNFDSTYFDYYNKDKNPNFCTNDLYVACTRGKEYLSLIHHSENKFLPFIKKENLNIYCDFILDKNIKYNKNNDLSKNDINFNTSITDLIKHLSHEVINDCIEMTNIINVQKNREKINIPSTTEQKYGEEIVCDITGTLIPNYYEYKHKNSMTIYNNILKLLDDNYIDNMIQQQKFNELFNEKNRDKMKKKLKNINLKKINKLLYITNIWNSFTNELNFKINQINNYNWLSIENFNKCIKRLTKCINKLNNNENIITENEKFFSIEKKEELLNRRLNGYIDCIDNNNNVFEFKCTDELSDENYLQLICYMYMIEINNINNIKYNYYLYNILTNELKKIECSKDNLKKIIKILIDARYGLKKLLNDNEFIDKINNIKILY